MPMPPVPMTARVKTSLGGVKPGPPRTCRGTMVRAANDATGHHYAMIARSTFFGTTINKDYKLPVNICSKAHDE